VAREAKAVKDGPEPSLETPRLFPDRVGMRARHGGLQTQRDQARPTALVEGDRQPVTSAGNRGHARLFNFSELDDPARFFPRAFWPA
jgi:hypothetical protein